MAIWGVSAAGTPRESEHLIDAAWAANSRLPPSNSKDTWRGRIANAQLAVNYLRQAEALPHHDPQVKQDLVYLLDGLAWVLLAHADDNPEFIADAVAAAGESVERQAALFTETAKQFPWHNREVFDALDTLRIVLDTSANARWAAGLQGHQDLRFEI